MNNSDTLLFATGNSKKLEEIRDILQTFHFKVKGLADVGIHTDIPETGDTLEENAFLKASFLYKQTGMPTLAEDTGLEVNAINGAPGVYTARYAGPECDPDKNMTKLLSALENHTDRTARFRTVIVLFDGTQSLYFEGIINGKIATQKCGKAGFGYDPVFIPEGYEQTFAELPKELKNNISHRALALKKLTTYLKSPKQYGSQ